MQKIKFLLSIALSICLVFSLSACGNNENWLSPMMSVSLDTNELDVTVTLSYLH